MATLMKKNTLGRPSTMTVLEGNPCPECGFDHGESDEQREQPMPDMHTTSTASVQGLRLLPEEG